VSEHGGAGGRAGEATLAASYALGGTEWPVGYDEWEARARAALDQPSFDYIAGGAGSEQTMRANREAFYRRRLVPRMLRGTADRDLSVEVLGARSPHPFFLAPIGVQGIAHVDAELATARAAAATRTPMIVSSASSTAMEAIAEALGETPRWFQLYWVNDREVVESLVHRAEASGYSAIVLTLDTLYLGWRDRDLRNHAFLPFLGAKGIAQFTSDPVFRGRLAESPEDNPLAAGAAWLAVLGGRARLNDDVVTGVVFTWLLGLGVLFLSIFTSSRATGNGAGAVRVLFGSIFGIDGATAAQTAWIAAAVVLAMLFLGRPLLFASLDPGVAEARGVPVRALNVAFLVAAGVMVAQLVQVVGALLLLGLITTPAATAHRLTARPWRATAASVAIAVATVWAGLWLSYLRADLPPSSAIVGTGFCAWLAVEAATRLRRAAGWRAHAH